MSFESFSRLLFDIFCKNGLDDLCNQSNARLFHDFTGLLIAENQTTNLTAIRDLPSIIAKHYADSLFAERFIPQNATVLDVGCGGGFPTVPLAICRPDLQITCIDSTGKKISFVEKAARTLNLQNIIPVTGRIEDPKFASWREKFAVVIARAVANLRVLSEITLPFARTGGFLLAMKGAKSKEELDESQNAIKILGGGEVKDAVATLQCPELLQSGNVSESVCTYVPEVRHLIQILKTRKTPDQYPRSYANIIKNPL